MKMRTIINTTLLASCIMGTSVSFGMNTGGNGGGDRFNPGEKAIVPLGQMSFIERMKERNARARQNEAEIRKKLTQANTELQKEVDKTIKTLNIYEYNVEKLETQTSNLGKATQAYLAQVINGIQTIKTLIRATKVPMDTTWENIKKLQLALAELNDTNIKELEEVRKMVETAINEAQNNNTNIININQDQLNEANQKLVTFLQQVGSGNAGS